MAGLETQLTAEEVQALLQYDTDASPAGPANNTGVIPFDFRRPEKMSKEHEQSLRVVQGNFARNISSSLSTFLRSIARVELGNLVESSYEEFMADVASPTVLAVCSLAPLEGKILFAMDAGLALAFVDRLMGGQGDAPEQARELTEIEIVLLRRVFERILASLHDAWASIVDVNPVLDQIEPTPHFIQLVPATDAVIDVNLMVSMRAANGSIRLCLPYHMIKPVIPKLHEHLWLQDQEKPVGELSVQPEVRGHLLGTAVEITAELGSANITVAELLDLQVGDCVVLDTQEGADLPLTVAGQIRLRGTLGVAGRFYAINITRWDDDPATLISSVDGSGKR